MNDDGSASSGTLRAVFGSDLSADSDGSNQASKTTVPVPPTTEGPSPQRYRYSLESLRTFRHNRRIALPENISHNRDGPRRKIPTLKPNPPTPFTSLSLPKELSDGLASLSLTTATPIQATAIPYGRLGGDLVAQATSGTGKTLTYALVVLDSILPATPTKSALIIVPARELAAQVAQLFTKLSRVRVVTLVGGTKESIDEDKLSKPAHVVVGTPGRVEVMVTRGSLDALSVKVLVLDEADRLLDGSFGGSVERICNLLPPRQTLAFSATFSYSFRTSLLEVMREPAWIGGSQVVYSVIQYKDARNDLVDKIDSLRSLLQRAKFNLCVVFFNTKKAAARVVRNLTKAFAFQTRLIHASMTQKQRDAVIREVRQGKVSVLVTTDVLARGIDFDTCDFVVHMDVPHRAETYLHRVGRAGRFGREGISLLMYDEGEASAVLALEEDLGYTIGSQAVLDGERPFKAPQPKDAPDTMQPLMNEDTSLSIHDRQKNERCPQPDTNDITGKESQGQRKESAVSALTPESDKVQPESDVSKKSIDNKQVQIRSDAMTVTKKGSSQLSEPVVSSSSAEKAIAQVDHEQNKIAVDIPIPDMLAESFQAENRSTKELQPSLFAKRPIYPEEPGTPAKKRKSARVVVENFPAEDTGPRRVQNAESFAESPKLHERASATVGKRHRSSFEWRTSPSQQNGDHCAPSNEENSHVAGTDADNTKQVDGPVGVSDEQRNLEKVETPSRRRVMELARPPSRDPVMQAGQRIVAKKTNRASDSTKGPASAAGRAQADGDPSDDIPYQQHLNDNNRMNAEQRAEPPETQPYSEQCQEAWDRYAEAAYDTGYREAYEDAFRMARELRQRLERTVE